MKRRLLAGIYVVGISLVFGALWNAAPTRAIQVFTPTPVSTDDLRVFPGDLVCNRREQPISSTGPSWMGITVGQSTLDDVEVLLTTFRYEYRFIDDDDYDIRFVIWDSMQVEEGEPTSIRLCLDQDVVQVIAVGYAYPLTMSRPYISGFVAQIGEPDAITWDNGPSGRVAFWFEQGFAIGVSVVPNDPDHPHLQPSFGRVGQEIYFLFQDAEGYENRWPYNQTRKFNPYLPSPEDPTVDFGPENPFNLRAMIATITAEPLRTPTPTFAPAESELEVWTATPLPNPTTPP